MGMGSELLLLALIVLALLPAAVVSWACVRLVRWERNFVLLGGAACGCITSVIGGVGLYLLVTQLPGASSGGNPWGSGGGPTIAATLFLAAWTGVLGGLVGFGMAIPSWLSNRLAGDRSSASAAEQPSKHP